mgnify:CR=1 FL=1
MIPIRVLNEPHIEIGIEIEIGIAIEGGPSSRAGSSPLPVPRGFA